ncbi:hypothetical protein Fmac_002171 [Flemingia macrophylla]|uniref:VAN3-binding protein n=1 Tax=Flemingia macrophylla TaxID=520843 RepID=A0ABD1NJB3_9FABA
MEGGLFAWRKGSWEDLDAEEELKVVSSLPPLAEPPTPREPMEFLSRSWSLSASEISKALSDKQKQSFLDNTPHTLPFPQPVSTSQFSVGAGKMIGYGNCRRMGAIGKWLHQKQLQGNTNDSVKKKDRARVENARVHSALSIAGLASAVAAVVATEDPGGGSRSKFDVALAHATQLLASYCVEMAELAGADHPRVASTVRSAVDIQTPGDLMTLSAAAATALRAEAALTARLPKEAKKNASISPYDKETHWLPAFDGHTHVLERHPPCLGDLLQLTDKGALRWKHVHVYIKKCQVKVKIKSKHVGGAFSKKNKCVVYGVCDKDNAWPYRKEREASEELYFGLKTAQGLLEFKCQNKLHKQKWVEGIQFLLSQVKSVGATEHSLEFLSISSST